MSWIDYSDWPPTIGRSCISLLARWIEFRFVASDSQGATLPHEGIKYLFTLSHNKLGQSMYSVKILQGLEFPIPSTAPKRMSKMDEMSFTVGKLSELHRSVLLSWCDPYAEFKSKVEWRYWVKTFYNCNPDKTLRDACELLQKFAERKSLVPRLDDEELRGWKEIAGYLKCSVPTAIKRVRLMRMPVTRMGGEVYSTRARLKAFLERHMDENPYWQETTNEPEKVEPLQRFSRKLPNAKEQKR